MKKARLLYPILLLIVLGIICIAVPKQSNKLHRGEDIISAFPNLIEEVPVTNTAGFDNKLIARYVSKLIQYDYNVYTNIYLCGHLPYDKNSITYYNGIKCAKVTSDYFANVNEIKKYLYLLNGTVYKDPLFSDEYNQMCPSNPVDALYFEINGNLYINVDEISLGRKAEKWSSFSFELTEQRPSGYGQENYYVIVSAVMKDTGEIKEYPYNINWKDDRYICTTKVKPELNLLDDPTSLSLDVYSLVNQNEQFTPQNLYYGLLNHIDGLSYNKNNNMYLISSTQNITYTSILEYTKSVFSTGFATRLTDTYFYQKDNNLYYTPPWKDFENANLSNAFYRNSDCRFIYLDNNRAEFIITSRSIADEKIIQRYFTAIKEYGKWKLLRFYPVSDNFSDFTE